MKQLMMTLAVSAAVLASGNVLAEMYKWKDDSGKTIYSQTPPPDGRDSTSIAAPPPKPSKSPTEAAAEQKAADEAKHKGDPVLDADLRKQNCDSARHNLKMLNMATPDARFKQADGSEVKFSQAELNKKVEENKALEKAWCDE